MIIMLTMMMVIYGDGPFVYLSVCVAVRVCVCPRVCEKVSVLITTLRVRWWVSVVLVPVSCAGGRELCWWLKAVVPAAEKGEGRSQPSPPRPGGKKFSPLL